MTGSHGQIDGVLGTLRQTDRRLRSLTEASTRRVLEDSADPGAMAEAYAAIRGEAVLSDGVEALRRALRADGLDERAIAAVEGLFLNAAMRV